MRILITLLLVCCFSLTQAQSDSSLTVIYGHTCGFIPQPPNEWRINERWIRNEELDSINGWLSSENNAKVVYAITALIRMQDSINLSTEQISKITRYKVGTYPVATCQGCVIEFKTSKEVLERFHIK